MIPLSSYTNSDVLPAIAMECLRHNGYPLFTWRMRENNCHSSQENCRSPMIEQDHQRFRQIVKGKIREDLRKFITRGELIGKEGKHLISIPVHGIEIPTFRYGDNSGGIGAGDGEEGQAVGQPGDG